MCSLSATRTLIAVALLGAALGGCSEYFDRRDTVTLYSGEAMAANRVTQTIDPWPAASANNNIAYNGAKAATASERYRTGRVIQPVNAMTSSTYQQQQQSQTPDNNSGQAVPNAGSASSNSPTK